MGSARLDQFVAGGDHHEPRLAADAARARVRPKRRPRSPARPGGCRRAAWARRADCRRRDAARCGRVAAWPACRDARLSVRSYSSSGITQSVPRGSIAPVMTSIALSGPRGLAPAHRRPASPRCGSGARRSREGSAVGRRCRPCTRDRRAGCPARRRSSWRSVRPMHCSRGRVSAGNGVTRASMASWAMCGVMAYSLAKSVHEVVRARGELAAKL